MKLFFVYNTTSGITQGFLDTVRKAVSPDTHDCQLTRLTSGPLSTKPAWRNFLRSLPVETLFFHRDEFANQYPGINTSFPVIFKKEGTQFSVVVSSVEINSAQSLDELIELMKQRLNVVQG